MPRFFTQNCRPAPKAGSYSSCRGSGSKALGPSSWSQVGMHLPREQECCFSDKQVGRDGAPQRNLATSKTFHRTVEDSVDVCLGEKVPYLSAVMLLKRKLLLDESDGHVLSSTPLDTRLIEL